MNYWGAVLQRLDLHAKGAWLVYIGGTILFLSSIVFKRKLTWREWYITFGVVGLLAWIGNIIFFFQLDLLDSGDPSIGGIPDLFMFTLAPPSIALLYLNFVTTRNKWILTSLFVGFSLVFEYLLVKAGFLIQKGWHVWYSIPFYFLFFHVFLPWHLHYIRGEEALNKEVQSLLQTNPETDRQASFMIRVTKWVGNEQKTPFLMKWKVKKEKAR
ncbi:MULTISPECIES: hypothetical protein [unclassified Paenibacillus]|uniref:hypothetical protein n=1 Tax=unclassified Paenibacillus TaxID=185978 RepID=UPI001AE84C2A|nr:MULTISPECIES: hypothetical protein [unclassified Paenibacillus]MBP1156960.1 hypothetical protein [Paenibacillus sp. PvP091]MBP1172301.1 hypothetical protein [Paenibacillus sp. PvR098]MBP2438682.1 hypothetical protein [Paenibacillus sp. PvP052]